MKFLIQGFGVGEISFVECENTVTEGIDVATQNHEIVITMDSDGFCKVVNLSGQIVYESEITGRVNRIPVPPGAYLVGIIVQQEQVVQKVIVK